MVTVIVYGVLAVSSNVSGTSSYVIASWTSGFRPTPASFNGDEASLSDKTGVVLP